MKKKFTITVCLLAVAVLSIAQQASKELAKSFSTNEAVEVVFSLPNEPTIVVWEKSHISVTVNVQLSNFNQGILNELARVGRYDLTSNTDNGILTISATPKLSETIQIRGQDLSEQIQYTVFLPKGVPIQMRGVSSREVAMRQ